MKILIDSTFFIVDEMEGSRRVRQLLNYMGDYNARRFQEFVDKILTPSQQYKYVTSDTDLIYTLSKKREKIMMDEIKKLSIKK